MGEEGSILTEMLQQLLVRDARDVYVWQQIYWLAL
jgi:hypothetical protein